MDIPVLPDVGGGGDHQIGIIQILPYIIPSEHLYIFRHFRSGHFREVFRTDQCDHFCVRRQLTDKADRIRVMNSGAVTGLVDARTATKEEIGLLMTKTNQNRKEKA